MRRRKRELEKKDAHSTYKPSTRSSPSGQISSSSSVAGASVSLSFCDGYKSQDSSVHPARIESKNCGGTRLSRSDCSACALAQVSLGSSFGGGLLTPVSRSIGAFHPPPQTVSSAAGGWNADGGGDHEDTWTGVPGPVTASKPSEATGSAGDVT